MRSAFGKRIGKHRRNTNEIIVMREKTSVNSDDLGKQGKGFSQYGVFYYQE
jgi:hypothetical protein